MVESTIKPKIIEIDTIKNGVAEILAHWDIVQIDNMWQYQECRMKWTLPKAYSTRAGVQSYLKSVESEILNWAKGSKVNL